jgi:hypothetical protein
VAKQGPAAVPKQAPVAEAKRESVEMAKQATSAPKQTAAAAVQQASAPSLPKTAPLPQPATTVTQAAKREAHLGGIPAVEGAPRLQNATKQIAATSSPREVQAQPNSTEMVSGGHGPRRPIFAAAGVYGYAPLIKPRVVVATPTIDATALNAELMSSSAEELDACISSLPQETKDRLLTILRSME